ncbi:MAG TPA: hypothetical protein VFU02_20120 [Polyangiaceae bacterium]|nr:hypothetical protein [Polyangiaceae bacterium]
MSPATLFASTDAPSLSVSRLEPDGRRLIVSHGMRMVQHRDGSIDRALELLPSKETVQITALPQRLGGGYLFYLTSSSATMVWSASEFTGKLKPLANVDFGIDSIVPGFDRLYLMRSRSHPDLPVAIDQTSGEPLDLGPLPASPSYETLAFADGWMGAVAVPLRGVLATFDAGASWHPVPDASRVVQTEYGLVLRTSAGWGLLSADGGLRRWESRGDDAHKLDELLAMLGDPGVPTGAREETVQRTPRRPLGRDPLRQAVLHGVMGPKGSAYVAHLGALGRVSLQDGKLLEVTEDALPANANCHGIRLGSGFGFVCSEERGPTTIYALGKALSLEKVLAFAEPRYVADNENGDLVVRGRCEEQDTGGGYYCLLTKSGLREIRVRGDIGAERVALLKDGTAVVLVPPRKGTAATLTRVSPDGKATPLKLKLPTTGPVANLIREGIWLNGFVESGRGELLGWVAGTGPFVGIRIRRDGKVEHGEVQNDVERALISGRFALLVAQYGQALETVDGGFAWTEVPTLEAPERRSATTTREQGCSPIGCATAEWLRIGWTKSRGPSRDAAVEPPERTELPSPGGGRWTMHCYPTGEASPRAIALASTSEERERARRALSFGATPLGGSNPVGATLESTAWQPFFEMPAPRLPAGYLGFDTAVEHGHERLQAYVWGQRGADWSRTGVLALRVLDRFAAQNGVWSSEITRSPWPDELSAAAAFGQSIGGSSASWQYESEASGREGLLLVRQPSQTELFIVAEGRAVTRIRGADGLVRTSGVVRLGSSWHFGAPTVGGFSVYKIVGDQVTLVNTYPFDEERSGSRTPRLVRNTDADALAIVLDATSHYVYPVNVLYGSLDAPLRIAPVEFSKLPPRCAADENGFVFTDAISVAPFVELMGRAAAVNATRIEARFIATATGLCVEGLAALASAVLPEPLERGVAPVLGDSNGLPVPMVLSEQGAASRRWRFECQR